MEQIVGLAVAVGSLLSALAYRKDLSTRPSNPTEQTHLRAAHAQACLFDACRVLSDNLLTEQLPHEYSELSNLISL